MENFKEKLKTSLRQLSFYSVISLSFVAGASIGYYYDFIKTTEALLDEISEGKKVWHEVVHSVYTKLTPIIDELAKNIKTRKAGVCQGNDEVNRLSLFHNYDFRKYPGKQPLAKIARNLVDYEVGKIIFETALGIITKSNTKQLELL